MPLEELYAFAATAGFAIERTRAKRPLAADGLDPAVGGRDIGVVGWIPSPPGVLSCSEVAAPGEAASVAVAGRDFGGGLAPAASPQTACENSVYERSPSPARAESREVVPRGMGEGASAPIPGQRGRGVVAVR